MSTLHIVPLHSFVDLITNSSSELFVCDNSKSVDTFKKTLVKLAELHNARNALRDVNSNTSYGNISVPNLFRSHFQSPTIQPYTFRLDLYPKFAEYRSICDWKLCDVHAVNVEANRRLNDWKKLNPSPKYCYSPEDSPAAIAYNKWTAKERAASDKFFAKWNALQDKTQDDMYRWAFEQNGLDWDSGKTSTDTYMRWRKVFKDSKIERFISDIQEATSYGFSFKKGDIMLQTSGDNTVPYDFFDEINAVFKCTRIHLG